MSGRDIPVDDDFNGGVMTGRVACRNALVAAIAIGLIDRETAKELHALMGEAVKAVLRDLEVE